MTSIQSQKRICGVSRIVKPAKASDGAGVSLYRSIGSHNLPEFDPFLLLDEFGSKNPDDYIAGFPDHPHRGFETVTYMLNGRIEHRDSVGNSGIIESGGIQWMTAGRGIIHSEMPKQEKGLMRGFQIWVNLPAKDKMKAPFYQNINKEIIPSYLLENGSEVKVIAGHSNDVEGIIRGIATQPLFLDVHLKPKTAFNQSLEETHNSFVYLYEGELHIKSAKTGEQVCLEKGSLGILTRGNLLSLKTETQSARFLCLSGRPLNEPIIRHGPFVMNSLEEIEQAISDFRKGRLVS